MASERLRGYPAKHEHLLVANVTGKKTTHTTLIHYSLTQTIKHTTTILSKTSWNQAKWNFHSQIKHKNFMRILELKRAPPVSAAEGREKHIGTESWVAWQSPSELLVSVEIHWWISEPIFRGHQSCCDMKYLFYLALMNFVCRDWQTYCIYCKL